jgi:hypothetical protein
LSSTNKVGAAVKSINQHRKAIPQFFIFIFNFLFYSGDAVLPRRSNSLRKGTRLEKKTISPLHQIKSNLSDSG